MARRIFSTRRPLLALVTLTAWIATAVPASAATEIGASTTADRDCDPDRTTLQIGSSNGPSYRVPDGGGVVTSWGFTARNNPGTRRLKLLVPTESANGYVVTGQSAAESGVPNAHNSFRTRIPVSGGEVIGLYSSTGQGCAGSGDGGFAASDYGDVPPGATWVPREFGPGGTFEFSRFLELRATVEPDADRDGYGDETQDGCSTDARIFATGCGADLDVRLSVSPDRVRLGDKLRYRFSASNAGPAPARGAVVSLVLPRGSAVVTKARGCTGFATLKCSTRELAPGGSTPQYEVVVRAPDAGELTATASVAADIPDPVQANNSTSAVVSVAPRRFAGVSVTRRPVRVARGKVPVRLACPIYARTCRGRLALVSAASVRTGSGRSARRLSLGSAAVALRGGQARTVRVRLPRAAARYLRRAGRVRVRVSARTTDAFSQIATRKSTVVVLAERR